MGMASSQARLLTLTSRLHSIEHKAQKIEAEKLRLANDSDKVYNTYLDKLEATKIQYSALSADGSITHKDATLNAMENGVTDWTGETSKNVLFLQNQEGKILVTPAVRDKYGLVDSGEETRTLDEFVEQTTHKTKTPKIIYRQEPVYKTENVYETSYEPDYDVITGFTPINNVISQYPTTDATYSPVANSSGSTLRSMINANYSDSDPSNDTTITISSAEELKAFLADSDTTNKNVLLTNDIDMTGISFTTKAHFSGKFDGNGYAIIGLNNTLFNSLDNAEVTNLELRNVNITGTAGQKVMGSLANESTGSLTMNNVKVSGNVKQENSVSNVFIGGLIGKVNDGTGNNISNVESSVNLTNIKFDIGYVGGIFGYIGNTNATNCKYNGSINIANYGSSGYVGGITGCISNSTLSNSSSSGAITIAGSKEGIGGIAGRANNYTGSDDANRSYINNCSSNMDLSNAKDSAGGILGSGGKASINSCYSSCSLPSNGYGIVGNTVIGTNTCYISVNNCNTTAPNFTKPGGGYMVLTNSTQDPSVTATNATGATLTKNATSTTGTVTYTSYSTENAPNSASIVSIASNMKYVFEKAGITVSDADITNWLNNNFGTNNTENNKKLASLNDNLCNYLSGASSDASLATNLKTAIQANNTNAVNGYLNGYSTAAAVGRSTSTATCSKTDNSQKGKVTIPSKDNIATELHALLVTNGKTDVTKTEVQNWVNSKYGSSSDDKTYLANLNDDICNKRNIENIYNAIKGSSKYTTTTNYSLGQWDVTIAPSAT